VNVPEVTETGWDSGVLGPQPTPQHIHLGWAGPTSSTFVANWKTDNGTTATQLLYGTDSERVAAADGPSDGVQRITGHHMLYSSALAGDARVHEVHVCGLQPATTYYYKVGAPGAWSAVYDVATGPQIGFADAFRFSVAGDSRDEPQIFAQIQQAVSGKGIDFQLFTGDIVNLGGVQAEWDAFFEATTGSFAGQEMLARAPFMVVNGNHDALTVNYVAQFAVPQELTEGESAQGEEWYSFDYGNAHFVALNDSPPASAMGEAQKNWLKADLARVDRQKTPWIFAMHHRSTYSCGGSHGSDLELRAAWQPIFDEYRVDMVFAGHDHLYERSKPMRGLSGQDGVVASEIGANDTPINESGTLYVVAGGAGAPLYGADGSCAHTHVTESVQNYVLVEVDGRTLRYSASRLDGSVLDQFEITK
jgi:hypothetical protein